MRSKHRLQITNRQYDIFRSKITNLIIITQFDSQRFKSVSFDVNVLFFGVSFSVCFITNGFGLVLYNRKSNKCLINCLIIANDLLTLFQYQLNQRTSSYIFFCDYIVFFLVSNKHKKKNFPIWCSQQQISYNCLNLFSNR